MALSGGSSRAKSISYRAKEKTRCPVCGYEFNREQLHSGGGRLIAGKLTSELRRTYEVSKKYGRVYPLAYTMIICPQCLFTSFPNDFGPLPQDEAMDLQKKTVDRRTGIEKIVGPVNFQEDRNLVTGAASYILAIDSYQNRGMGIAPTPKKAICSIRAAWLFSDMNEEFPGKGFDKLADFMYMKAVQYYNPTLDIMSNGREPHEQFINLLGPDTDNNWGFDGVVYLNGYLTKKYLSKLADTVETQLDLLEKSRRHLGKLYGMGKASKSKPSVIIDLSKDLYEAMTGQLEKMKEEAGIE